MLLFLNLLKTPEGGKYIYELSPLNAKTLQNNAKTFWIAYQAI